MAGVGAFVRKGEVVVRIADLEVVVLEIIAGGGVPVVVSTDESFAVFVDGKNRAGVGFGVVGDFNVAFLVVDGRGDFVVENFISGHIEIIRYGL